MAVSGKELREAREAAENLLEEMGLEAYLFEVEPREGDWEVRVECALDEGWQTAVLPVAKERLLAASREPRAREALLEEWGGELADCRRGPA